jgi:hypothetical protein
MVDRSRDWFRQAERDMEQAELSRGAGHHEWCCFVCQQATEKVVEHTDTPWELRGATWDTTDLPVPADLLVYSEAEWGALHADSRFRRTLRDEVEWLVGEETVPR